MANFFHGLARGPLDHNASSVINLIANGAIQMGSCVINGTATMESDEILPRVFTVTTQGAPNAYGIAVGGDADGVYNDGSESSDAEFMATTAAGQGVVIVTQGRCLARVTGSIAGVSASIAIGDPLTNAGTATNTGHLEKAANGDGIIARALHPVLTGAVTTIAVDVQREGVDTV